MSTIKKCPLCGGEATICSFFFVQCSKCGLSTLTYLTESEAIKVWNTRTPIDRIIEQFEEQKSREKPYTVANLLWNIAIQIVKKESGIT